MSRTPRRTPVLLATLLAVLAALAAGAAVPATAAPALTPAGDDVRGPADVRGAEISTRAKFLATRVKEGDVLPVQVTSVDSSSVPSGTVTIYEFEAVVGRAELVDGVAAVRLPRWVTPAHYAMSASYEGDSLHLATSTLSTIIEVLGPPPVASTTSGKVSVKGRAVRVAVRVTSGKKVTGDVELWEGRRLLRPGFLDDDDRGRETFSVRLRPGRHRLVVRYHGNQAVRASSHAWTVRVRR